MSSPTFREDFLHEVARAFGLDLLRNEAVCSPTDAATTVATVSPVSSINRSRRANEVATVFWPGIAQATAPSPALEHALAYASRGWHAFPAPPGEKKSYKSARHSGGRKWGATTDAEEICQDFARWPEANVGIVTGTKSGIFVVECDTPEGHDVDGIAALAALEAEHGPLPETLMAVTPSGSIHRYFKCPPNFTIINSASKIAHGVDVRGEGGMVIAPPSVRPGKGSYKWLNNAQVVEAPEWLIAQCREAPPRAQGAQTTARACSTDDIAEIKAALAMIPSDEEPKWFEIGCALAKELGDDGLPLFVEWSKKSKKFSEIECEKKWEHCKTIEGYNLGTVFHYANEASSAWRTALGNRASGAGDSISEVPSWLFELNKRFAWIEQEASIYRFEFNNFIQPNAFRIEHDNETVSKNAKGARVGKGTQWLKEKGRRQHRSLVFRPGEGQVTSDNCLNEWRGFGAKPLPGDYKPFVQLLERLVPERAEFFFVLNWLAHLVQHPDVKMHTSLVLWSLQQGVGKNLLFECVSALFGKRHAAVIGQAELESDFNSWAAGKVLVIGDEVFSSDKRQHENKLKGLITSTELHINEKFQPRRTIPNRINFVFLSNAHDAVFLADHDRRYFVWEIRAPQLRPSEATDFVAWRDQGGLKHLLDFLLKFPITGFDPKAPAPTTVAKSQMIEDCRSDLESWVADLMGSDLNKVLGRELASSVELADRYRREHDQRNTSTKAIVGAFKRLGAYARPGQVRLSTGKKVRALALANMEDWKGRTDKEWAAEMMQPRPPPHI